MCTYIIYFCLSSIEKDYVEEILGPDPTIIVIHSLFLVVFKSTAGFLCYRTNDWKTIDLAILLSRIKYGYETFLETHGCEVWWTLDFSLLLFFLDASRCTYLIFPPNFWLDR
jgi:hypothetical protein